MSKNLDLVPGKIQVQKELLSLKDDEYQKFISGLLPGVDNILGVRIPVLRRLAKEMAKDDWQYYLSILKDDSFEELMLQGLIIAYIRIDFQSLVPLLDKFIPKINNWSICDTFCSTLKVTKEYKEPIWSYIKKYLPSDEAFNVRFSLVLILNYYIEDKYIDEIFHILNSINNRDYYVEMAIAWTLSYCFISFPIKTEAFLRDNKLSRFSHNMGIQKIVDSRRVSSQSKTLVRKLKIKEV